MSTPNSLKERYKQGKNILNLITAIKQGQYSSATFLKRYQGDVTLKGIASTYQYIQLRYELKAGTYTFQRKYQLISGAELDITGGVIINDLKDNSQIITLSRATPSGTFTINQDTTIQIYIYLSSTQALSKETQIRVYDIQLEKGSVATSYEPYRLEFETDRGEIGQYIDFFLPTTKNEWYKILDLPANAKITSVDLWCARGAETMPIPYFSLTAENVIQFIKIYHSPTQNNLHIMCNYDYVLKYPGYGTVTYVIEE